jgi:uncharacterized GH25 family protein
MRILALSLALFSGPLLAHEFWIQPQEYQIGPDQRLRGELMNGQYFEGSRFPYHRASFQRFEQISGQQSRQVLNRQGAKPALDTTPIGPGLAVVIYESGLNQVSYDSFDEFAEFAEHKGFGDVGPRHREAGHSMSDFGEVYTRFAKTLVAVGNGAGADARTGMEAEIVALTNPYTDDLGEGMKVQVFYREEFRPGAQVEVFERAPGGDVEITIHQADQQGIAAIPVKAGHRYLIDSVVLREPAPEIASARDAAWETLWASLTFAVPE